MTVVPETAEESSGAFVLDVMKVLFNERSGRKAISEGREVASMVRNVDGMSINGAEMHCLGVLLAAFEEILFMRSVITIATNVDT